MVMQVAGKDFGCKLCELLGLDPDKVREVTVNITAKPDNLVDVTVSYQPIDIAGGALDLLQQYELSPIGPPTAIIRDLE